MKKIHIIMLCVLTVTLLFTLVLANISSASKSLKIKGDGFVVMELFTSEGCSSCPPADELLAKVQRQAGNQPVYVLSYHVDYWDHQGWRDVFSNPDYSKRQYEYATKFGTRIYTPQVVVNGKTEFVGSDAVATNLALISGLSGKATSKLQLNGQLRNGQLVLNYQVNDKVAEDELAVAVVQKSAVHQIKRGENQGLTLSHAQIVRSLQVFPLGQDEKGQVKVMLPKEYNTEGWEIIGLLQGKNKRVIHGATKAVLTIN